MISFGLKPQDKLNLHKDLFSLIYYGQGFTHEDVYNMPVYLKRFYLNQLLDIKNKEKKQTEKSSKGPSKIARPPSYKKSFPRR